MSNEFKHASVGSELSQAEWEAVGTHAADGQTEGDHLRYKSGYWVREPFDIGARVYNSANQIIGNASWTNLTFDSERYDTDTIHSTSSNTDRLTAARAGKYIIIAQVKFAASTVGMRGIRFLLNGATGISYLTRDANATAVDRLNLSTIYNLAAGDYVTVGVYQSSGGNLDVIAAGNETNEFMMQRIG